jgi:hypothetical protein
MMISRPSKGQIRRITIRVGSEVEEFLLEKEYLPDRSQPSAVPRD